MSSVMGDPNALGADPDELERLAASMNSRADILDGHRVTLHATIHQAAWMGVLADAFRREWQTSHTRVIAAAADALRSAANLLLHRAEAQRKASAPDPISTAAIHVGVGGIPLQGSSGAGLQGGDAQLQGAHLTLVTAGSIVAVAGAVAATAGTIAYPLATGTTGYDTVFGVATQHNFGNGTVDRGECTSWAIYRRQELGLSLPKGDGGYMAASVGAVAPSQVAPGSLISMPDKNDPAGHVVVVEQVYSTDPLHVRVSEMNYRGNNDGSGKLGEQEFTTLSDMRYDPASATWTKETIDAHGNLLWTTPYSSGVVVSGGLPR